MADRGKYFSEEDKAVGKIFVLLLGVLVGIALLVFIGAQLIA